MTSTVIINSAVPSTKTIPTCITGGEVKTLDGRTFRIKLVRRNELRHVNNVEEAERWELTLEFFELEEVEVNGGTIAPPDHP